MIKLFKLKGVTHTIFGFFFGMLFPILGSLILLQKNGEWTFQSFLLIQKENPLLWIIDTAPFFLGLFAAYAGFQVDYAKNHLKIAHSKEQDLSLLIDTANAPIFGIDSGGRVNEWNQVAEAITGYSRSKVLGQDLVENFITEEYRESVKEVLDQALEGKETANYEFPLYTLSGNRVDILLNSTSRRDNKNNIIGVVGVGQNITELKKVQSEVLQSSKLATLGEMATGVAHELNQPLNTINFAVNNLITVINNDQFDQKYFMTKLARINKQVNRASSIINHMRMFGRKSNGHNELFEIEDALNGAIGIVDQQFKLEGIQIIVNCQKNCKIINGEQIQLEQVLLNLLINAKDAIISTNSKIRKITFDASLINNSCVLLKVSDTGGGIPDKTINHIFEPFFTTKNPKKGTGLGLSISYNIINGMGGKISVSNTDEGAQFLLSFPT